MTEKDVASFSRIEPVNLILETIQKLTGMRLSIIVRIDDDSWTACAVLDRIDFGLKPGDQLELSTTYCNTAYKTTAPLIVKHASQSELYKNHPGCTIYGIESYFSVPLFRQNGESFGVLCVLDPEPKEFSDDLVGTFELFASLITYELEAEESRREAEELLRLAQQSNDARARFMSILGHDLRNPLNTILMAAKIQSKNEKADDFSRDLSQKIIKSSQRMQKMINDLLDTTRTEQQITLPFVREHLDLYDLFSEITEEFRLSHPARTIVFEGDDCCEGKWDAGRTVQVLSNFLSNALHHSPQDSPVKITLRDTDENVRLSVWNRGKVISPGEIQNLFQPYWRGTQSDEGKSGGLGLGLYIVQEIMESHGGSIEVESTEEKGTTFTAVFPK